MDFYNGKELMKKCQENSLPISDIMKLRETTEGSLSPREVQQKLETALSIMKRSATIPLATPGKSIGGLIGGEAKKISEHGKTTECVCGSMLSTAIAYSMAVLEVNASMGLIVAAPTAGSAGVVPGVLLALAKEHNLGDEALYKGLLNASAMAASAIVEMMGGTPGMCLEAASFALSNLLGLVCDPIAGLVESPCQSRNAIGVANAITAAELVLSGVRHHIPFDEMAEAMLRVGRSLPFELRETAMGGCAGTPTACTLGCGICSK